MGAIANAFIDALRSLPPATLALSLSQLALLAFMFYALAGAAETRNTLVRQLSDNAAAINAVLQRCTPAPTP